MTYVFIHIYRHVGNCIASNSLLNTLCTVCLHMHVIAPGLRNRRYMIYLVENTCTNHSIRSLASTLKLQLCLFYTCAYTHINSYTSVHKHRYIYKHAYTYVHIMRHTDIYISASARRNHFVFSYKISTIKYAPFHVWLRAYFIYISHYEQKILDNKIMNPFYNINCRLKTTDLRIPD